MNCEFTDPIDLGEGDFEFSKIDCDTSEIYELIQNETYPDRQFYVQKTFTYGEAIIVWFLTLFLIYFVVKTIFSFFWKND